ncbi:unnamed protein product [Prorocentrum cordatum]|uniref:Uncharacterized protein n=1 Tax=Prorocentrum cordatum TaxID=2364126 RepID=A0ABN9SKF7_9DINO|nr:unnamed protein product [Polarella glacialis]
MKKLKQNIVDEKAAEELAAGGKGKAKGEGKPPPAPPAKKYPPKVELPDDLSKEVIAEYLPLGNKIGLGELDQCWRLTSYDKQFTRSFNLFYAERYFGSKLAKCSGDPGGLDALPMDRWRLLVCAGSAAGLAAVCYFLLRPDEEVTCVFADARSSGQLLCRVKAPRRASGAHLRRLGVAAPAAVVATALFESDITGRGG